MLVVIIVTVILRGVIIALARIVLVKLQNRKLVKSNGGFVHI